MINFKASTHNTIHTPSIQKKLSFLSNQDKNQEKVHTPLIKSHIYNKNFYTLQKHSEFKEIDDYKHTLTQANFYLSSNSKEDSTELNKLTNSENFDFDRNYSIKTKSQYASPLLKKPDLSLFEIDGEKKEIGAKSMQMFHVKTKNEYEEEKNENVFIRVKRSKFDSKRKSSEQTSSIEKMNIEKIKENYFDNKKVGRNSLKNKINEALQTAKRIDDKVVRQVTFEKENQEEEDEFKEMCNVLNQL